MFSATRRWFRRNRTPIAVGVGVIGAGYVVTQYVLSKINDARERMSTDRIAKENLRRRFEQNQEDCTFTVVALLPSATAHILETMNTESITYEIQQLKGGNGASKPAKSVSGDSMSIPDTIGVTDEDGRSMISMQSESGVHASQITMPPATQTSETANAGEEQQQEKPRRTKRQLWGDLKISSITRAFTLIYTLGLLTMLTRIQLNLLGRRSYLSSVVSLATGSAQGTISLENNDDDNSNPAYGDDFEINRKYLTFSWWLLNKGWVDIMERVEAAVREVFGDLSPRDQLSLETFQTLTGRVRKLVEGEAPASPTKWLAMLLPPADMEGFVLRESGILDDNAATYTQSSTAPTTPQSATLSASLRRLLDETSDLIESPTFSHVFTQLLDAGFSKLINEKLATTAFDMPQPTPAAPIPTEASGVLVHIDPEQSDLWAEKKVILPKILSVLTRQAHSIGEVMPNEYLQSMEAVKDLEGFAAVVYSSNWENEIRDDIPASNSSPGETEMTPSSVRTTAQPSVRQSLISWPPALSAKEPTDESLVLVDPSQQSSTFESAWAKVTTDQS